MASRILPKPIVIIFLIDYFKKASLELSISLNMCFGSLIAYPKHVFLTVLKNNKMIFYLHT